MIYQRYADKILYDDFQIKGNWYAATTPDIKCNGTLEYNGKISLEVFDSLTGKSDFTSRFQSENTPTKFEYIYGVGEQLVTLINSYQSNSRHAGALELTRYSSSEMVVGVLIDKSTKIQSIGFEYPFVWGPFKSSRRDEESNRYKINVEVNLDDKITFKIGQTVSTSSSLLSSETYEKEFFKIEWEESTLIEVARKYQKSINHFLQLCMGKPVYPSRFGLIINKEQCDYFPHWTYNIKHLANKFTDSYDAKIKYFDIKDDFKQIISKWVALWLKTHEIMFDFFNIFESKISLETQFTELCNVSQKFYTATNSDDPAFASKLRWFLALCPAEIKNRIEDNDFVDKIVDTRGYHVHGDGRPRDHLVTDSRELFGMIHDMISLIEIFLMSQIGINEICKNQVYQKNKTQYVI